MDKFPICLGRKNDNSKLNIIFDVIIVIAILMLVAEMFFYSRFARVYVIGDSMLPTFTGAQAEHVSGGDFVYVDKYRQPERGDVVVISTDSKIIIKRVIALGGDSVELKRGSLYVNDQLVKEPYVSAENNINPFKNTYPRTVVPEGCMFFLGDNRDVSNDSRSDDYGMLDVCCAIGVVAEWSITCKGVITAWNTFVEFTIPGLFGVKA